MVDILRGIKLDFTITSENLMFAYQSTITYSRRVKKTKTMQPHIQTSRAET